jgi:hypothetical protein
VRYKEYTYTFNGFKSSKGDTIESTDDSYTFKSDETLTVQWERSPESAWQPIYLPYPQPRDGYTFNGWQVLGSTDHFNGGRIESDVFIGDPNNLSRPTLLVA